MTKAEESMSDLVDRLHSLAESLSLRSNRYLRARPSTFLLSFPHEGCARRHAG